MAVSGDVLQAKQTLSHRLLRAGLRGRAVGAAYSLGVREAVASAGGNVHAVGVGRKVVGGEDTGMESVRIYVAQKLAASLLPPRDRLPEEVEGVPTDVIEAAPAFLMTETNDCSAERRNRQRPVVGGISAAHRDVTAGTISYFCRSTRHGDDPLKVYVLSNNHVFADVNRAREGDDLYQPGSADGGVEGDHFAELHRFVPIEVGGEAPNRVDAAIGELLPEVEHRAEVCGIGGAEGTTRAGEGMEVRKHGRTTGLTEGVVTDESLDALIGMDHNNPDTVALFENQIRIERTPPHPEFGMGGDSGSLVFSGNTAVGLYFAGPSAGDYGLANHISDVLSEMEIELL